MKVAIIDYGMGNIASVDKAVCYLGYEAIITNNPIEININHEGWITKRSSNI